MFKLKKTAVLQALARHDDEMSHDPKHSAVLKGRQNDFLFSVPIGLPDDWSCPASKCPAPVIVRLLGNVSGYQPATLKGMLIRVSNRKKVETCLQNGVKSVACRHNPPGPHPS